MVAGELGCNNGNSGQAGSGDNAGAYGFQPRNGRCPGKAEVDKSDLCLRTLRLAYLFAFFLSYGMVEDLIRQ